MELQVVGWVEYTRGIVSLFLCSLAIYFAHICGWFSGLNGPRWDPVWLLLTF